MRRLASFTAIIVCLVLLMPVAGGCSEPEEENRFLELLSLLPAEAKDEGGFALVDYEAFRQANGISLYTADNQRISRENFHEMILAMFEEDKIVGGESLTFSSYYTGWSSYTLVSPIRDENIGYNVTDVDAEINNINIRPYEIPLENKSFIEPDLMIAAIGSFDAQATEEALKNRDEWPSWAVDNHTSENHHNITIHSWGDVIDTHLKDTLSPPHIDNLGRARPIAVSDGYLFVGCSVDDIKSMIDSSKNESSSLADVPEYALVAQGMYDLAAYGVIIADEVMAKPYPEYDELDTLPRLKKFVTFGTGFGVDETGAYIALVLVHDSHDKAKENALLLEQLIGASFEEWEGYTWSWSDHIYATQIHAEGEVLLAKLYTDHKMLWYSWFFDRWPLVLHEQ